MIMVVKDGVYKQETVGQNLHDIAKFDVFAKYKLTFDCALEGLARTLSAVQIQGSSVQWAAASCLESTYTVQYVERTV